jgi:outer membrane biosynthesis protein TonB
MTSRLFGAPSAPRLLPLGTVVALALLAACASNPEPELVAEVPVRVAPPVGAVKYGDCAEALRRAREKSDLDVDRLPTPKALVPAPLPGKSMPAAVRKAKYSEVRVTVLVDTLGTADMSTFNVLKSTHPWLASSVKSAVAKWKFEPAQLAGCKVPRQFKWSATAGTAPKA